MVKANSAPDSMPGTMLGRITQRMVCEVEAPRLREACSSRTSKFAREAETVITT